MPSRVIRGEINSSRSLAMVSRDARLTFRALLNVVDDFGRFDGRISFLRSQLFPVDPDVTDVMLAEWLGELTAEQPIPPVAFYYVDGAEYLHLPGWEKHRGNQRRRKVSTYPDPPADGSNATKPLPRKSGNSQEVTDGVGVGVEKQPAASQRRSPTKSSQKRKTQCPEELDAEQWARVFAWRDREHPKKFWDAELQAQWKLCRDHHIGKGNLWVDWVRAFYSWLTGPFYKQATTSDAVARTVPLYVGGEKPPDPLTEEELEKAMTDQKALRDSMPRLRRRLSH